MSVEETARFLRPGMGFGVDVLQSRDAHVRVELRCGELGVSEELLYEPQIRPGVEQMCGVRMPQLVRGEVEREVGQREVALEHALNRANIQTRAVRIHEHGAGRSFIGCEGRAEMLRHFEGHATERTQAFLFSLSLIHI